MMLRICIIVFLMIPNALTGITVARDTVERQRDFVRALELFDQAKSESDYRESAKQFEAILASGIQSGAVYYNLGNAYYRAGEIGRAILNYRKAKLFRPRDSYLEANLQQALSKAPGRLVEVEKPWWTHVFFWNEWISLPSKFNLCTAGAFLAGLLGFLSFWLRRSPLMWLAIASLVFSLAVGADGVLTSPELLGRKLAVIVRECVAKKGTAESYEPAFDRPLMDGAEFTILSETDDWVFGHFNGIGDGWVRRECTAQ